MPRKYLGHEYDAVVEYGEEYDTKDNPDDDLLLVQQIWPFLEALVLEHDTREAYENCASKEELLHGIVVEVVLLLRFPLDLFLGRFEPFFLVFAVFCVSSVVQERTRTPQAPARSLFLLGPVGGEGGSHMLVHPLVEEQYRRDVNVWILLHLGLQLVVLGHFLAVVLHYDAPLGRAHVGPVLHLQDVAHKEDTETDRELKSWVTPKHQSGDGNGH